MTDVRTSDLTLADARSLGQRIAELGATLPEKERVLLSALLRQAIRVPHQDVRGFRQDPLDGVPDAELWRLIPLEQAWLDALDDGRGTQM